MATTKLNRKVIIQLHVLKKKKECTLFEREYFRAYSAGYCVFTLVRIELSVHLLDYPLVPQLLAEH